MSTRWRRAQRAHEAASSAARPVPATETPLVADTPSATPADIEALLSDVRSLRLMLAADLAAAAGAADAGADDLLADILSGDQREVAGFSRRSRDRLLALSRVDAPEQGPVEEVPVAPDGRWRRRALVALPTVPLVGAMALSAAAAMGLVPLPTDSHYATSPRAAADAPAPVATTFNELATVLANDPSESQVVAAATALHRQIEELIAAAPGNPAQVNEAAKVLQLEQALLMRAQAPGSARVLAASRRLAQRLLIVVQSAPAAPHQSPAGHHPTASPTAPQQPAAPTSSPSSTPTHSPAPSHSPTPTSTTWPASSPSPSPSSSGGAAGHLPSVPR